jgi:hypothetical protein
MRRTWYLTEGQSSCAELENRAAPDQETSVMTGRDERERAPSERLRQYEAPKIESLGTLVELTQGGTAGAADGAGMAGSSGTLP